MLNRLLSSIVDATVSLSHTFYRGEREDASTTHGVRGYDNSMHGATDVLECRPSNGPESGKHVPMAGRVRTDGGEPSDGEIKLVMAYIRPDKLGDVKQSLAEVGASSLTVTNVSGRGSQPAKKGQWRGEEYTVDLHQKIKLECVVADIPTMDVVEAIADGARIGEPGDGKVFVLPIESAHQIRTGRDGSDAV